MIGNENQTKCPALPELPFQWKKTDKEQHKYISAN